MRLDPLLNRLSISDKNFMTVPLTPNWAQQEFLQAYQEQVDANRPVRLIVLKARQLGVSTITEALMFLRAKLIQGSHGLVVAHETDSSEHLFSMTHLYWETFPWRRLYTTRYMSRREMAWRETGSTLRIATAKNVRAGRGRTITSLHASEVGFWDRPNELMLGLRQSVPNNPHTMIVLESTANGVGNYFYHTWQAAVCGDVEYQPLFFPWWRHPEYTSDYIALPSYLGRLNEEERVLQRISVDDEHLAWRRWAINNLCGGDINRFHQEYPSTPEEAFIVTGTNVFPISPLRAIFHPEGGVEGFLNRKGDKVEFAPAAGGPLTVYRKPATNQDWGKYYIGGDPSHSTFGDYACAQVINRRTYEQVAIYRRKTDPMTFAEELAKLGIYYNTAGIAPEVEGPGYATIGRLIELDYPNIYKQRFADKSPGKVAEMYGWSTSWKRKEWAIGFLIKLITDQTLVLHDQHTFDEMRDYVTMEHGGYEPADSRHGHDDTVMAMAIACICAATEGPPMAYSPPKAPLPEIRQPDEGPAWEGWAG